MFVEPGLLDANVLVYAVDSGAAQHAASDGLLEAARNPATVLHLTSQIFCEFYPIVTNPRRIVRGHVAGWMALPQRHPVTGGDVFDFAACGNQASQ
jgi:hypothetical protein